MSDKSTKDRVVELHTKEPELTQTQIAERLKIDGSTVSRYLKASGTNGAVITKSKPKTKAKKAKKKVKAKANRGGVDRGVKDKVLAEFKQGNISPTEVAAKVGCSVSYVVNLKKKEGLAGKKAKPTKKAKKVLPNTTRTKKTVTHKKATKKAKRKSTKTYPTIKDEMVRDVRLVLIKSNEQWDNGDLIVTHRYRLSTK